MTLFKESCLDAPGKFCRPPVLPLTKCGASRVIDCLIDPAARLTYGHWSERNNMHPVSVLVPSPSKKIGVPHLVASHGLPELVVTLVRTENLLRPIGHVSYLEILILAGCSSAQVQASVFKLTFPGRYAPSAPHSVCVFNVVADSVV